MKIRELLGYTLFWVLFGWIVLILLLIAYLVDGNNEEDFMHEYEDM